jgi:aryl-alcohol dehydrogenase-like predicted oxidoreductase
VTRVPLDHYVTLGRSGLRVSPMCLGTLTFGEESGYGTSPAESTKVLEHYVENGGNFIDTANYYSYGHAETIIGDALAGSPGRRDRLVIATKFGTNTSPRDPNSGGASRKAVIAACEQSLRRLRTDYIDLYWQHFEDPFTPVEETVSALDELVRAGKVRYLGLSDSPAWRVVQAQLSAALHGWTQLIAVQLEYSLAERRIEAEHVPMARELGLGIMPFALLAEGLLSGKYRGQSRDEQRTVREEMVGYRMKDRTLKIVDAVAAVARRRDTTSARVALAWALSRPGVTSGIIGAKTVGQLDENIAALELRLGDEDLAELDLVSRPPRDFSAGTTENMLPVSFPGMTIDGRHIARNRFSPRPDQRFR